MMIALTPRIPICRTAQYFNPHFREGSDGQEYTVKGILMLFQSTLPQGKWLSYWTKRWRSMQISIHTSAREVTAPVPFLHWKKLISIHTSAREVTWRKPKGQVMMQFQSTLPQGKWRWSFPSVVRRLEFQSTLPQGKWRNADGRLSSLLPISIHTSAREVTVNVVPAGDGFIFQSTLPQGKWRGQDGYAGSFGKFQSTLPQGKWQYLQNDQ